MCLQRPGTALTGCCDLVSVPGLSRSFPYRALRSPPGGQDGAKAERYRTRFGFERAYTDIGCMLTECQPHALVLIAPVELTCELSCKLLATGLPLMMEKPPGVCARGWRMGGRGSVRVPVRVPVCVSVCLSVCLPACLPACLSACLSVCLSACLSVRLSVCLSGRLAVWLAGWLAGWLPVCRSVLLPVCRSVCVRGAARVAPFPLSLTPS